MEELAAARTLPARGLWGMFLVTALASFLPLLSAPTLADVRLVALLHEITKPAVFKCDVSSVAHVVVEHFEKSRTTIVLIEKP